jgi:uncharacterized membrane protein
LAFFCEVGHGPNSTQASAAKGNWHTYALSKLTALFGRAKQMTLIEVIQGVSDVMDGLGVAVVALGVLWGLFVFIKDLSKMPIDNAYKLFRNQIIRALLLGLEILVAGDIIRTVAVSPTLMSVAVLGAIVVIRCFLSWSLALEMNGRWPWQSPKN